MNNAFIPYAIYDDDFIPEYALAQLLVDDVLFTITKQIKSEFKFNKDYYTQCVFVILNDTFGYACADAEGIESEEELKELYIEHMKNKTWGSTIWASKKRKMKPLPELVKKMKDDGVWTDELENL